MKIKLVLALLGVCISILGTSQNSINYQIAIQEINEGKWHSQSLSPDYFPDRFQALAYHEQSNEMIHDDADKTELKMGQTIGKYALIGAISGLLLGTLGPQSPYIDSSTVGVIMAGLGLVIGSATGAIAYNIKKRSL